MRAMISEADGDFSNAPNFKFNDDKVKFDTNRIDNYNDNYGSASGFLPEFLEGSSSVMELFSFLQNLIVI